MLNHGSSPNVTPNLCPCVLLFPWLGQARTWLSRWLCEFYCCARSSKIKALRKGILWKLFSVSAFTFISSRFEHKPWGMISAVAPVWLGGFYRSFRSLHHLTNQQQEMLQPWFSSPFKKYALPWPSCMVFYLLKGGLIASPLSPRFPQQPNCKCSQATPWSL